MTQETTLYIPSDREVGFISAYGIAQRIQRWKQISKTIHDMERENGRKARAETTDRKEQKQRKKQLAESGGIPNLKQGQAQLAEKICSGTTQFIHDTSEGKIPGGRVAAIYQVLPTSKYQLIRLARVFPIGEEKKTATELDENSIVNQETVDRVAKRNPGLLLGGYVEGKQEFKSDELQSVFDGLRDGFLPRELMGVFPSDFIPEIKKGKVLLMGRDYQKDYLRYHYAIGLPGGRLGFVTKTTYGFKEKRKNNEKLEGIIRNPFLPDEKTHYLNPHSEPIPFLDPAEDELEYLKENYRHVDITKFRKEK